MRKNIHISSISELPFINDKKNEIRKKISCIVIGKDDITSQFSSAIYFDALIAILVLSGNGTAFINYKAYSVNANMLLLLSPSHLFHFCNCSKDFKCLCLFVSKQFMDEMDSTDMIYKRTKYGVRLYSSPLILLNSENAKRISERILSIENAIENAGHFYYKELILNNLFAFYLDLSDIIEKNEALLSEGNLTRYESIIKSFIELLVTYYREEHKVEFYASKLNISAHYLTLIVKRVTRQSVADFIFEMLYSEARTLLIHSQLSIQEIATNLNFSDQSSFGKFFKRKAGVSPYEFRKKDKTNS